MVCITSLSQKMVALQLKLISFILFSAPNPCLIFPEHPRADHCPTEIWWSWESLSNERSVWITVPHWCISRFVWQSLLKEWKVVAYRSTWIFIDWSLNKFLTLVACFGQVAQSKYMYFKARNNCITSWDNMCLWFFFLQRHHVQLGMS